MNECKNFGAPELQHRMGGLKVPIVTIIVGEDGSGGALAIAMGNKIGMLSQAYYSTITPEGAASILGRYKDDDHKKVPWFGGI